jgi:S-ribosylhomocysteine lyase LuxS involved in autoinducer biosynthesis
MKTRKPLINEEGEVRELTAADLRLFRPAHEVLPPEFVANLPKSRKRQQANDAVLVEQKIHAIQHILAQALDPTTAISRIKAVLNSTQ